LKKSKNKTSYNTCYPKFLRCRYGTSDQQGTLYEIIYFIFKPNFSKYMNIKQFIDKTEQVSSIYAKNHGINRDKDWFIFKLQEELGELTQKYLMMTGRARKK